MAKRESDNSLADMADSTPKAARNKPFVNPTLSFSREDLEDLRDIPKQPFVNPTLSFSREDLEDLGDRRKQSFVNPNCTFSVEYLKRDDNEEKNQSKSNGQENDAKAGGESPSKVTEAVQQVKEN